MFLLMLALPDITPACAQPAEVDSKEELFKITRNKDANEIIYYLNTTASGKLDLNQPIEAYWIRYDFQGQQSGRPLNAIEKRYAYGLKFISVTKRDAHFQFVAIDRDLFLRRTPNEDFVLVEIKGDKMRLSRLHLILGQGSFWVPEISAIEIHAVDAKGNPVLDVIKNPRRK